MALSRGKIFKDHVEETTSTTGTTTNLTLTGATLGNQAFATAMSDGQTCDYAVEDQAGLWEVGEGTYVSSSNAVSRDVVLDGSSGAGTKVDLGIGAKVWITQSAARIPTYAVPRSGDFTQVNFGGSTVASFGSQGLMFYEPGPGAAVDNLRQLRISTPSTPYRIEMGFKALVPQNNYPFCALGFSDGTKLQVIGWTSNNNAPLIQGINYSNASTYAGSGFGTSIPVGSVFCGEFFFAIADDGTNVYYRYSIDGSTWFTFSSFTRASGYLGSSGYLNPSLIINSYNLSNTMFNGMLVRHVALRTSAP